MKIYFTFVLVLRLQIAFAAVRPAFVAPYLQRSFTSPFAAAVAAPRLAGNNIVNNGDDTTNDDNSSQQQQQSSRQSRRDIFRSALMASTVGTAATATTSQATPALAAVAARTTSSALLADLPMIRFKLPNNNDDSAKYVATQMCLRGQDKPVEFMLDTGLTLELITPRLRDQLGLRSKKSKITGLSAGGASAGGMEMVDLRGASLCDAKKIQLNLPDLHAVVTDFPQEHIDPKHDPIEGMLGLEVLSQFDIDLDFKAGRIRLYKPGTAAAEVARPAGLVEIPAVVINDTGILGIRLTTSKSKQPVLGFIDCGSTFSAINWKGATVLGLPPSKDDPAYKRGPTIVAVGVDGRPIQLATLKQSLSFVGGAKQDSQGRLNGFQSPPNSWKAWDPIYLAVGDLPVFPDLLGDGVHQYTGPAALIGLDILTQRRVIIESAGKATTRRRRLFVSPA